MFNLDHILRVAAAAGALVLSAVTIGATVGPDPLQPQRTAFVSIQQDRAHG